MAENEACLRLHCVMAAFALGVLALLPCLCKIVLIFGVVFLL